MHLSMHLLLSSLALGEAKVCRAKIIYLRTIYRHSMIRQAVQRVDIMFYNSPPYCRSLIG